MAPISFIQFFRQASPGRRVLMISLGLCAFGVVAVSGWAVRLILFPPKSGAFAPRSAATAPTKSAPLRRPAAVVDVPPYTYRLELPNFSISLPGGAGHRSSYAQFSLVLDCPNAASKQHLELNRAKLRDRILSAALPYKAETLRTTDGQMKFRTSVLFELKGAFGEQAPRGLSFESFIVQ